MKDWSKVERYDAERVSSSDYTQMEQWKDGEWVKFTDFDSLLSELRETRRALEMLFIMTRMIPEYASPEIVKRAAELLLSEARTELQAEQTKPYTPTHEGRSTYIHHYIGG